MKSQELTDKFGLSYEHTLIGSSLLVHANCFDWLSQLPQNSIHAIVTDPPYGVKEYESDQLEKRHNGTGGIWRIPPTLNGHQRAPLPRFTVLNTKERQEIRELFMEWSRLVLRVLCPGGHVFLASNTFISQLAFNSVVDGGLEWRGEVVRLVRTLRGGDRPKNAEEEFPDVSSLPRGCYEPWGLFRKPIPPRMKVSDCLREFRTGGLRRLPNGNPFSDIIVSERTPKYERNIADHPSLKPQSFLRQLVYASLPLGEGIVLDPFAGSGSTVAAAEFLGLQAIGVERHAEYYQMALKAVPHLKNLSKPLEQWGMLQLPFDEAG